MYVYAVCLKLFQNFAPLTTFIVTSRKSTTMHRRDEAQKRIPTIKYVKLFSYIYCTLHAGWNGWMEAYNYKGIIILRQLAAVLLEKLEAIENKKPEMTAQCTKWNKFYWGKPTGEETGMFSRDWGIKRTKIGKNDKLEMTIQCTQWNNRKQEWITNWERLNWLRN